MCVPMTNILSYNVFMFCEEQLQQIYRDCNDGDDRDVVMVRTTKTTKITCKRGKKVSEQKNRELCSCHAIHVNIIYVVL